MGECVCDLYGPDTCGCLPSRLTEKVHAAWTGDAAAQVLDAIALLLPGEMKRRWCHPDCAAVHEHTVRRST